MKRAAEDKKETKISFSSDLNIKMLGLQASRIDSNQTELEEFLIFY